MIDKLIDNNEYFYREVEIYKENKIKNNLE